jgi:Domain of unknown function (DUF4136)
VATAKLGARAKTKRHAELDLSQVKPMKTLFILLLLAIAAVSVNAQKVKVGADPAVDVSRYKTYAWSKPTPPGNPFVQQTIIQSVEQALAAKGLTKVEENPDMTVAFYAAANADMQISYPTWYNSMGSAESTGINVNLLSWQVTKGMLVIDIADSGTKSTVWRGSATQTLEHGPTGNPMKDAKTVEKPIRKAVEKMFKQYPRPS